MSRKINQHTPGPWRIEAVYLAPHRTHFGEYRFPHQAVDGHSREYPHSEAEANAHLIAAAPDLLEALKEIDSETNCTCRMLKYIGEKPPCDKCRFAAVIAKAEGRPLR